MGYTHYYRYPPGHPSFQAGWPRMVADARRIVERVRAGGVVINGFDDAPPVSTARIAFDGDGDNEETGEPFVVSPTLDRLGSWEHDGNGVVQTFCKTERYPYDLAVTAILLRCQAIAPDVFQIHSDGDWAEDWGQDATHPPVGQSTRALVTELFGECPAEAPFTDYFA